MSKFAIMLSCLACASGLLCSCDHKDLCYDHGHMVTFNVKFDWQSAPDATPNTMVAQFFANDGSHYRRTEFIGREGGSMKLDANEYKVIFHNGEMETVDEAGDHFHDYILSCIPQSLLAPMGRDSDAPRPSGTDSQPIVSPPDVIWAGIDNSVTIKPLDDSQSFTFTPEEITSDFTVEIKHVENLTDGVNLSAAISGMSGHFNVSQASPCGQPVTVPFALERRSDRLVAQFKTFGHCPTVEERHILTIYTSSKFYFNFDVTDQIHSSTDPRHVVIEIDNLKIPSSSTGTGISPSISGWDEVVVFDIGMQ